MVESLWMLFERVDRLALSALDRVDKLRNRDSYLSRIQKYTATVRAPQRVIEFDQ